MRYEILGPLQVVDEAGGLRLVAASRQRVLLAALLLRANQPVSVGELADVVWDGAPPAKAVATVRTYVMRLRHALGPEGAARIVFRDPGYLIRLETSELDLLQFEALCQQAGASIRARAWDDVSTSASRALELWRGTPLVDVSSQVLRDTRVPHLEQLRVQALEWRIEADLHRACHEQLIPQLEALVTEHPLRERFHAQLILALGRGGRRAEALAAYQNARRVLVGELGIEPGPELRGLQERILAGEVDLVTPSADGVPDPASGGTIPRQLPAAVRHFAGRVRELDTLSGLLDQTAPAAGMVVISAIDGTAGIGKTALAVHWAHQHADRFPDGQLYVNLRGFDPGGRMVTPAEAVRAFLDALGVPAQRIPTGLDAQAALYRSLLAGKRILIVLDNARDGEQARPLLPGTAGCLALVTSRNQLTTLVAATGAHPLTLDLLTDHEARQLLARRLGPDRVAAEPAAVNQIVAACARLPLALAIAAARAQQSGFRLAAVAAELHEHGNRPNAPDTGDILSHVHAVFSWSYTTLTPPAARLFRLLGLHPGPHASAPAAASLIGLPPARTRPLLAELTRAGLLGELAPGRYGFHDLLRAYAAGLARTTDSDQDREAATVRLLDHYLHTAHNADRHLMPTRDPIPVPFRPPAPGATPEPLDDHDAALEWLAAERPVLLAAQRLAADAGQDTHAWQLAWALHTVLYRQGGWHEQAGAWRTALAPAARLPHPAAAYAHSLLGQAVAKLGDDEQASTHLHHALHLYTAATDPIGQARTHYVLAFLWSRRDRPGQALDHAQQALALFQAASHSPGQAAALNAVGWYHTMLGDHTHALTHCQQALALFQQLGDRDGQAAAWDSLGYAHHHLGDHTRAADCYEHALALFRELGDHYETDTLTRLGDTHYAAGRPDQARAAWTTALNILTSLGHPDADQLRAKINDLNQRTPTHNEDHAATETQAELGTAGKAQ
jgi:DNA-binding SARP family transcriptional activator/tetratricopeptide (TPR) repeat protein